MKKRILCLFLAGILTVCLAGCGYSFASLTEESSENSDSLDNSDLSTNETENTAPFEEPVSLPPTGVEKTLKLNSSIKGVHVLGKRVLANRNYLNCDYSGSGMEFSVDMQGGDLTVLTRADGACNFLIWVDGNPYQAKADSLYFTINGDAELVIKGLSYGKHTIRIVKVTGYEQSQAKFFSITLHGTFLTNEAPAEKDRYVEFLGGDSASGLGVLGNGSNTYTGQDATKAYPYLLAEQLGTEYNVLALSDKNLLESMSEAYLYASIKKDSKTKYDFSNQTDVTVIHIKSNGQSADDFFAAYRQLVRTVRAKNGENCRIVCVYHQDDTIAANAISEICSEFGGDEKGYFFIGVNQKDSGMLTEQEQNALAQALTNVLEEALNTVLVPDDNPNPPDTPTNPDDPVSPDPPAVSDVPGVGNGLTLGTDDIEMKLDSNDPAWDS